MGQVAAANRRSDVNAQKGWLKGPKTSIIFLSQRMTNPTYLPAGRRILGLETPQAVNSLQFLTGKVVVFPSQQTRKGSKQEI